MGTGSRFPADATAAPRPVMDGRAAGRRDGDGPQLVAPPGVVPTDAASQAGMDVAQLFRESGVATARPPVLLAAAGKLHLLVMDDDEHVLRGITEIATAMGFVVHPARTPEAATELLERHSLDVMLLDLLPREGGISFVQQMKASYPRVPIVVMTAHATVNSAVDAMRLGASDFLTKPFAMDELTGTLELAAQRRHVDVESRRLQDRMLSTAGGEGLIGASAAIEKLLRMVAKVAPATHPVLIVGESGTGKELVARLIHSTAQGTAPPRAMQSIDCSALPLSQLETELFGVVRQEGRPEREEVRGLLSSPTGGTLLIREIAALPLDLQARLLRALQERKVRPTGSATTLPVTVRLLASSGRNLPQLVESGAFRKDLYFRLNVVHLRVPPLRERKDDIPLLAAYFLRRQSQQRHLDFQLDSDVLRVLEGYDWPGNVRELEGSIERACSFSSGPVIFLPDFPSQLRNYRQQLEVETLRVDMRTPVERVSLPVAPAVTAPAVIISIAELEKQAILTAIRTLKSDKLMAAKLLGIGKTTLYRKLKEYGIEDDNILVQ